MASTTPPGDTDELVDAVFQFSSAIQTAVQRIVAADDISLVQLRLLGILRDREPAMMQLATHLGLTKSSVTGLIDRAEKRGLVRRTSAPTDGRGVHVALTAAGRDVVESLSAAVSAEIRRMLDPLSAAGRDDLTRLAWAVTEAEAAATPGGLDSVRPQR